MDRKKLQFWELKEGQFVLLKFYEASTKDLSMFLCKVKDIHRDRAILERGMTHEGEPLKSIIFNTGLGYRSGLIVEDAIRYEIFESSEKEYLTELV
jgi:hypothetical protein